ncbi:MAG: hypothetical protein D6748_03950 [Calditrichaeota bacterium]|nr:MAG: hypothetical protein D6748_03950 [Calditrichota bacterium]
MLDWLILADDILKVIIAVLCGIFAGQLRESDDNREGVNSHILIAVVACLMTLVSTNTLFREPGFGTFSIALGMGLIGAGVIISERGSRESIKLALTLWLSAGLGMAIGASFYLEVASVVFLTYIGKILFNRLTKSGMKMKSDQ